MSRARFLLLLTLCLSGCATEQRQWGSEPEDLGTAHPAVYQVDSFRVQKWQNRRPATQSQFFFKKCSGMDAKTFWSKTSYECARF